MILWRPYTQMKLAPTPIPLSSAKGSYLYTKDGRKIFDGISSWWLITHGHGHEEISEAIAMQSEKLEQVVFANFSHEPAEELASLLKTFLPASLSALFLSDNGSTAVEVAMKIAYQYANSNSKSTKRKFVTFSKAYHGDTCGAMSVSANSCFTKPYQGLQFEVLKVNQGTSLSDPLAKWVDPFAKLLENRHSEICAVILEPLIQGAGGMIQWPIEAVKTIYTIAKEYDCLVIFDEVMTGFGRTSTMFAFEQINCTPDLLCLSKGITGGFLPLGATIASDEIFNFYLTSNFDQMLFHGHSYTGNALSCASACANLKIFAKYNIMKNIHNIKMAHDTALKQFTKMNFVTDTRVCGSIAALNLNIPFQYGNEISSKIQKFALELDLFIRPLGNTIYLMPPYSATSSEIFESWSKVESILKTAEIVSLLGEPL